jgi:hypothetical protein
VRCVGGERKKKREDGRRGRIKEKGSREKRKSIFKM